MLWSTQGRWLGILYCYCPPLKAPKRPLPASRPLRHCCLPRPDRCLHGPSLPPGPRHLLCKLLHTCSPVSARSRALPSRCHSVCVCRGEGRVVPGGPDLPAPLPPAEHVPSELWEPFYTDQYAQEHVKPPVTRLLLSAELYCRAWRQALPQLEAPPSPSALLALLARRGMVPALPERPVQEADLRHQPVLMVGPTHRAGSSPKAAAARQVPPVPPVSPSHRRGSSKDAPTGALEDCLPGPQGLDPASDLKARPLGGALPWPRPRPRPPRFSPPFCPLTLRPCPRRAPTSLSSTPSWLPSPWSGQRRSPAPWPWPAWSTSSFSGWTR